MAIAAALWHKAAVDQRNQIAGGFPMVVAIFAGLIAGIALHSPIRGVIAGAVLGAIAAAATWLIDRRRAP